MKRSRLVPGLAFALAVVLTLPAPAWATASTPFDLQTSATQTATGTGGGIPVPGIREMLVFFACTAGSGTGETLDVFLQASNDNTTWYDLPFELAMLTDGDSSETLPEANGRDFIDLAADDACAGAQAVAKYYVFGNYVRVKWFISGSSPSYTFSVKAIGKN